MGRVMATAARHATASMEGWQLAEYSNLHLALLVYSFHFTPIVSYLVLIQLPLSSFQQVWTSFFHSASLLIPTCKSLFVPNRLQTSHSAGRLKSDSSTLHQTSLVCTEEVSGVIIQQIHCLLVFWSPHGTNQNWVRASKYQKRSLIIISVLSSFIFWFSTIGWHI